MCLIGAKPAAVKVLGENDMQQVLRDPTLYSADGGPKGETRVAQ